LPKRKINRGYFDEYYNMIEDMSNWDKKFEQPSEAEIAFLRSSGYIGEIPNKLFCQNKIKAWVQTKEYKNKRYKKNLTK